MRNRGCTEKGCKNSHFGRGLCMSHYQQEPDIKKRRTAYAQSYYVNFRKKGKTVMNGKLYY